MGHSDIIFHEGPMNYLDPYAPVLAWFRRIRDPQMRETFIELRRKYATDLSAGRYGNSGIILNPAHVLAAHLHEALIRGFPWSSCVAYPCEQLYHTWRFSPDKYEAELLYPLGFFNFTKLTTYELRMVRIRLLQPGKVPTTPFP